MRRKRGGRYSRPSICQYCDITIGRNRPVFLLATTAGTVVGPYHPDCAARVAGASDELRNRGLDHVMRFGRIVQPPREETLPW